MVIPFLRFDIIIIVISASYASFTRETERRRGKYRVNFSPFLNLTHTHTPHRNMHTAYSLTTKPSKDFNYSRKSIHLLNSSVIF
jgi:hypothetical protein